MQITVSKESIRKMVIRKRLPKKFTMYTAGSMLFDLLEENHLQDKVHLWYQCYWINVASRSTNRCTVTFLNKK